MTRSALLLTVLLAGCRTTTPPEPGAPEVHGSTEFEWLRVVDARYAPPGDTTVDASWPGGVVLDTRYEPDLDAGGRVFIGARDVLVLDEGRVVQVFTVADADMSWVDLDELNLRFGGKIYSQARGLWPDPPDPSATYQLRLRGSVPVGGECGPVSEQVITSECFPTGHIVSPPFRVLFE